jgi:plasmid replication initiation protein
MDTKQIYKSNALVEASYRLSVYEQRVILACIAQVRHDAPVTDQIRYRVSAQEIAEMTGTQLATAYQNLRAASERLFERRVTLYKEPNGGPAHELVTRWVQAVMYIDTEGAVAIRFAAEILPYLTQLSEQFTRYALADVAKMSSAYAIRIYELLIQWRGTGERVVEIDWLRDTLQLAGRYSNIRDFKRWVICPAVEQINELSPMWVKWEQRKTGRRVTHFAFTFGEKKDEKEKKPKTKRIPAPQKNTRGASLYGIPTAIIEEKARPGESYEEAALRLLNESKKR